MELYDRIIRDLPPTPSKFHYIFNLRDLSRIYHGLFLSTPERFNDPASFVRVWRNECLRVFYDRLTNDKDRELVLEHVKELLEQYFKAHAEVSSNPIQYFRTSAANVLIPGDGVGERPCVIIFLFRLLFVILFCLVTSERPSSLRNPGCMRTCRTMMPPKLFSRR
jgi:hypothetical protein